MKKRLAVTGFGGFVAGNVVWQGREEWEVFALSRRPIPSHFEGIHLETFDLRETGRLKRFFGDVRPDAVIHTAALADIDYCQAHPEEAEAVNVGVTTSLVELCREFNAKLVHCSTDTVFDGRKGMYTEKEPPRPVNVYGETKVRSETAVLSGNSQNVVARLSLIVGFPVTGSGNSFLAKTLCQLDAGRKVFFPANEFRTPIDAPTVAASLLELAENGFAGTIHLAGSTRLNRYEMALRIACHLGLDNTRIGPTDSNAMPGRAPRPNDASLDNHLAREILATPMPTLEQGLARVLSLQGEPRP